jgi:NTE family protein
MPAVRFVASGGSAKGLLEITGALSALIEQGNSIEIGAGTSAGGVILGALASGRSPSEIKDTLMGMDFTRFISTGLWSKLRLLSSGNLSNGKALLKFFEEFTKGKTFGDSGFDIRITGADYSFGQPQVFAKQTHKQMPLALAMRITSAMPLAFDAVEYDARWFKDGGVYAHIPVEASREPFRTVIFALAQDPASIKREAWGAEPGIIREIGRTVDLLVDANVKAELDKAPPDAIKVFSDGLGFSAFKFDFTRAEKERLFAHGHELMGAALKVAGL